MYVYFPNMAFCLLYSTIKPFTLNPSTQCKITPKSTSTESSFNALQNFLFGISKLSSSLWTLQKWMYNDAVEWYVFERSQYGHNRSILLGFCDALRSVRCLYRCIIFNDIEAPFVRDWLFWQSLEFQVPNFLFYF